ncbi:hypothetical protein PR003_g1439 [Phytophthora rubi]|nr:hypothetical protein PR003_g1439 [Phytophthora rubi]
MRDDSDGSDSSASEFVVSEREAVIGVHDATPPRPSYIMVPVFESFSAAYRAVNDQSDDVHTYETRYTTERILARVYRRRSHADCEHRYKIKTINGLEVPT